MDESIKAFMKTFCKEKIKISIFLDSISIQAFWRGVLRISSLFSELMKTVLGKWEKTYMEAYKFST